MDTELKSWIKTPSLAIYEGKMGKAEKWTLFYKIIVFVTSFSKSPTFCDIVVNKWGMTA